MSPSNVPHDHTKDTIAKTIRNYLDSERFIEDLGQSMGAPVGEVPALFEIRKGTILHTMLIVRQGGYARYFNVKVSEAM